MAKCARDEHVSSNDLITPVAIVEWNKWSRLCTTLTNLNLAAIVQLLPCTQQKTVETESICLSAARKTPTSNLLKAQETHGALAAAKLNNMGLWLWTTPDISLSSLLTFDHSWGTEMQCKVKSHVTDRIHTGLECWLLQPKAKGKLTWRAFEQGTEWWKMAERKAAEK